MRGVHVPARVVAWVTPATRKAWGAGGELALHQVCCVNAAGAGHCRAVLPCGALASLNARMSRSCAAPACPVSLPVQLPPRFLGSMILLVCERFLSWSPHHGPYFPG